MAQSNQADPATTKIIIGPGRLSFPYLFEARETENGERYMTSLLLPPDYNLKPILAALNAAAVAGFGKDRAKWPKGMRKPEDVIREAAEKSQFEGYEEGWHFIGANATQQPGIVNGMREDVSDPRQVYPGRWAKISCNAFWYKNKTAGVSLGLNNVQLLKNDNTFGRTSAKNDFDDEVEDMEEEQGWQ